MSFDRGELLDLLSSCQTGETSCMRALERIEMHYVNVKFLEDLKKNSLELCHEIEGLPASEQQTQISILASNIYSKIANRL